ncbi:hypothetical protein ACJMK2_037197 [Sinanodonta woodiana]|uniref:receptor protein serine/threonine kinase n=2 Tax=Sinanodonta woodiana TaxID=1069815 RepID=A0ABD3WJJ5_SINWO
MAAWRCLSCWTFFLAFILRCWSEVGLMCEVANIQVESEDGRTQTFEMKKMEPRRGDYCLSCSRPSLSSAPHVTTLRSKLILSIADKEISSECDPSRSELPLGLCSFNTESSSCYKESPTVDTCTLHSEELAEEIVQKKMVPYATGETDIDKRIALGIVLFNRGDIEGSIQQFTSIIRDRPNAVPAYYGRGIAYSRKRLQGPLIARKAVADFKEVIDRDIKNEIKQRYERRAEAHISLGQYHKALEDLDKAVVLNPEGKASFARGIVHIIIGNFADAEKDFKDILDSAEGPNHLSSLFYLGLAQYYRGKVRNAIEVFKDVLKKDPENLEASTSLSQAFREIGNLRAARIRFNQSLAMNPYHAPTLLLRGSLMYYSGNPQEAFQDFQTCIDGNERNVECEYMKALSSVSMGNFYEGVKTATKIMVQVRSSAIMTASPEFLKAHYLREYARYLHSNLEKPLEELKLDIDLSEEFRDHWAKMLPFEFKCYAEINRTNGIKTLGCDTFHLKCLKTDNVKCCDNDNHCNSYINFTDPLQQTSKAGDSSKAFVIYATAPVSVFFVIGFLLLAGVVFRKWLQAREKREAEQQYQRLFNDYKLYLDTVSSGTSSGLPLLVQRTLANQITLLERIGRGRYGEVWMGKFYNEHIAVKVYSSKDEIGWRRETEMYNSYQIRHDNILTYYASDVCSRQSFTQLWLVVQYHKEGSLYNFLQSNPVTYRQMVIMCHSIAAGLVYLHQDIVGCPGKPAIVHRDMKSKNVLVKDDLTCCICDLEHAMAYTINWDFREEGVNVKVGTKRYMPPELLDLTIRTTSFSSFKAADMYSFGLVMWEIVMRCIISGMVEEYNVPYWSIVPSDPSYEEMHQTVVIDKIRPMIPTRLLDTSSLNGILTMIQECWRQNPLARLTALNVKKKLQKMVQSTEKENDNSTT